MPNQFLSPEGDLETFNYFVTEYWLIDQYVGDTLLTWGQNNAGQLGIDPASPGGLQRNTPVTTFAGGANWKQVSTALSPSGAYTAAIKTDGTLWTWGRNSNGQLGNNTTTNRSTPVTTFAGGTNWKQVSCGGYHTAAIKTDGTLWTWGYNNFGGLGNNTTTQRNTPVTTFAGGTNWKQVSCGGYHTAAIKTDGTLWTWGSNYLQKLGNNASGNRNTPITTFAGGNNWKQVACGGWGLNHIAAIKTNGTLWTWGDNRVGQGGTNTTIIRSTPVTTFAGGTNWKQVDVGSGQSWPGQGSFTVATKTDGTLWTWGGNSYGQLGNNTLTGRTTPVTTFAGGTNWKQVDCGFGHCASVKTDGTLWTWGRCGYGQLGDNQTVTNKPTPITTFAGGTNWKQVSAGWAITAAITSGTDPTFFIS